MGLLDNVLQTGRGLQDAATQATASSLNSYDAELKKTQDAKDAQARVLMAKDDATQEALNTPIPDRPAPPVYTPVSTTPPKKPEVSPVRTLVQMLPVLAALGASKTQESAIYALNAGTAAMNAMEANDKEQLAQAHQDWMDGIKTTLENNKILSDNYQAILNDRNLAMNDRLAKVQAVATQYGDKLALAALSAGNPQAVLDRQKILDTAADRLGDIYKESQRQQLEQQNFELTKQKVLAEIDHDRQMLDMQKLTVNGEAGQVARKIRMGEPLNDGDIKVWNAWKESNQRFSGMPFGAAQAAPADDLVATQAAAPATPQPAAKQAAPAASSTPPVSALKEGVVTTFKNGQSWTLRGGKAVRIK